MLPLPLIIVLLTVAFPLLELAILIKVGAIIGVWATLAIIIGTAVLGFTVAREQGLGVARRIVETMRSGEPPLEPMMEGMLLMFAGACLIAPGLITDCIGLVLLVPWLRQRAARTILERNLIGYKARKQRARRPTRADQPGPGSSQGPTIEGEYERVDEPPPGETPPPGHRRLP